MCKKKLVARPERNEVDYFPHPTTHGKGMFFMRTKYGNDAYVAWFMILEKLGSEDFHYLDLKDEVQIMYLSAELKVAEETLIMMIGDLVKLKQLDRELWETEKIVYNQKFVDSIADAYKKRSNEVVNKETLMFLLQTKGRCKPSKLHPKPDNGTQNEDHNPQRIGKDTKLKKSKVFAPPKLEEVKAYCKERKNKVDPDKFINHYESNGWMVGKNKMKSWQAAVRTWEKNDFNTSNQPVHLQEGFQSNAGSGQREGYGEFSPDAVQMPKGMKERLIPNKIGEDEKDT